MMKFQRIAILGATGSVGRSTLDVVSRHPDRFQVVALTASTQIEDLAVLCQRHRPAYACLADQTLAPAFGQRLAELGVPTRVLAGPEGLIECAALPEVDCVMAAIVGAAGLGPTLAAAQAGKKLLLANKEALVMAGPVFMDAVRRHGTVLLPIDSEHNAIFQCLPAFLSGNLAQSGVRRIILTGSGGPFRLRSLAELQCVTPEEACAHPNWSMGPKISVDSATMMNKALEIIEAHWLFGARADQIQVVVHPQSVIHSMVEYADGSVIAQLGNPDMRTPIAQALAFPDRIEAGVSPLDLVAKGSLTFEAPDFDRFPALRLAFEAFHAAGTAPAIMNAANEVAVEAFLERRLAFPDVTTVIEETLSALPAAAVHTLDDVMSADASARAFAGRAVGRRKAVAA